LFTLGSLFDGAGTCPFAAQLCGIETLWTSEIESFPVAVTQKRFPDAKQLGDIKEVNGALISPVDIISFGSPCQDLSVAGKREGLNGERSGLFLDAIRIIKEMRGATGGIYPAFAIWENVPGAFSSNHGEDFRIVLEEFSKIKDGNAVVPRPAKWGNAGLILADGYSVAWRVLDAQFWGVPQRRRRIYLVVDFGGQRAGEILFKPESLRWNFTESRAAREKTTASPESGTVKEVYDARRNGDALVSPTITEDHSNHVSDYTGIDCRNGRESENLVPTLQANGGSGYSLNSTHPIRIGSQIRRLTPTECARLQGMPDWWCDDVPHSDSAEYKMWGNGMSLPCILYVMRNVLSCMMTRKTLHVFSHNFAFKCDIV
jgi:DNA (cytosine-5)-methyltransferase 1